MRFSLALISLLAIPLSNAVAIPEHNDGLQARNAELDERTLGDILGGLAQWKDKWDNNHCGGWKKDDCSRQGKKCSESSAANCDEGSQLM